MYFKIHSKIFILNILCSKLNIPLKESISPSSSITYLSY